MDARLPARTEIILDTNSNTPLSETPICRHTLGLILTIHFFIIMHTSTLHKSPWIIWFFMALFYFYEYVLRSAPSIMVPHLITAFGLSGAGVATLIGYYYYSYAPLQLVAGGLLDHFGAKMIVPMATLLCALGCWLFTIHFFYLAALGRFLMGAGSAFAFVGITYVATTYIASRYHGLLFGLTQSMGMLGGVLGEVMISPIVQNHGWESAWWLLALSGLLLWIVLLSITPKQSLVLKQLERQQGGLIKNYLTVFQKPQTWIAGCIGGLMFVPTLIFAQLWGIPFFIEAHHFSVEQAAWLNSLVMLGWVIGAPLSGLIADKIHSRKTVIIIGCIAILILFSCVVYEKNIPTSILFICMFLIGVFSGPQVQIFAINKAANPEYAKGSVIGGTNFLVFIWAALLTPFSGWLLQTIHHGANHDYSTTDYQQAMLLILVSLLIALLLTLFLKNKHDPTL